MGAVAHSSAICADPHELKMLRAMALRQQLVVSARTCGYDNDYFHFLAEYRAAMAMADAAARQFFLRHAQGESYANYRHRVGMEALLLSVQDPRFCQSARAVFDLAFKRGSANSGRPPAVIRTGYETCRKIESRPQLASKPPARATPKEGKPPMKVAVLRPPLTVGKAPVAMTHIAKRKPVDTKRAETHVLAVAAQVLVPTPRPERSARQRPLRVRPVVFAGAVGKPPVRTAFIDARKRVQPRSTLPAPANLIKSASLAQAKRPAQDPAAGAKAQAKANKSADADRQMAEVEELIETLAAASPQPARPFALRAATVEPSAKEDSLVPSPAPPRYAAVDDSRNSRRSSPDPYADGSAWEDEITPSEDEQRPYYRPSRRRPPRDWSYAPDDEQPPPWMFDDGRSRARYESPEPWYPPPTRQWYWRDD